MLVIFAEVEMLAVCVHLAGAENIGFLDAYFLSRGGTKNIEAVQNCSYLILGSLCKEKGIINEKQMRERRTILPSPIG